jgi:hypothetical protein
MPKIKRKCPACPPPNVVCDYPTEPNVLVGVAYDSGAKNGSFDENARNVDPAEANVLNGVGYKIKNVAKSGTFNEAARNTDPTEALVIKNTNYKIQNVVKVGTFDEDARNVDPTEALVIKNTNYKIKNVAKVGSFDEVARNTDPTEANVADGVGYKTLNVAKTGTLKNLLPKTGQVASEEDYDDGYYHLTIGNNVSPRLINNVDNSIDDKATGLQWVKDHAAIGTVGGYDFSAYMTWDNALLAVNELNIANYLGHSNWRLPNIKELMSIVDYGRVGPAIDPLFLNTQNNYYWSSTMYAGNTTLAWNVNFYRGYVGYNGRSDHYYVRPVRQY